MLNYQYKTTPFAHQDSILKESWEDEYVGLFLEQRTGKSKIVLDNAAQLHRMGRINGLLIIAPNGVHRNWIADEIKIHLPDWCSRITATWSAAQTKKKGVELEDLFNAGHELRILSMNVEALGTKRGYDFARRFLNATACMMVVDESTRIKSMGTGVTRAALKLAPHAKYRRILNGTPVTQSPLDVYAQLLFLSEDALPVQSHVAFKARYADYLPASHPMIQGIMRKSGTRFVPPIMATNDDGTPAYKNLEELKQWVDKCCYRVTRKECADLPEKLYKRWEVELAPHQDKLIKHYLQAMKKGETPEPINKMVAVMLYQRMICGIIPKQLTGGEQHTKVFDRPLDNPRIQAVLEIIEAYPDASIIFWARFKTDLNDICAAITTATNKPIARYWGDISNDEREAAKEGFQAKRLQYFVGQQGAGGVGLPLHAADVMVYHSNDFSLYHRLQSEDRAENMLKKTGTLIIDIEAAGTVDSKIIDALRNKKDVADLITGDESGKWLE
jgi:SNF2 family DNA or RNA helicase